MPPTDPSADEPAAPPDDAQPTGGTAAWRAEVLARLLDAERAFAPDGATFTAEVREQGLYGRFDARGAVLTTGDDNVVVRVLGFGRDGALDVPSARPALGACIEGMADPEGDCIRRLEYESPGLVGWWVSHALGFQQGWTVELPPGGDGPLVIELGIDGAEVLVEGGSAWLFGEAGGRIGVSGLAAWDADGRELDIALVPSAEGFRVLVDDEDARYPVEIDPIYSTSSWTVSGPAATEPLGESVVLLGDVDGNGYDDVLYETSFGYAYVHYSSASGVAPTGTLLRASGYVWAAGGDVNADGYDDLLVSTTYGVEVWHGSAAGLGSAASATLSVGSWFGRRVSDAGDVNGDGYDDIVVGDYVASGSGSAYVLYGSSAGVTTSAMTTLTNATGGANFGSAVAGAGDVNADGYNDVVVGEHTYSSSSGQISVFHGGPAGASASAATTLTGSSASLHLGWSLAGVNDVDGDGYDDVAAGAYGYSAATGRVYVYRGSASGLTTTGLTTLTGASTYDYFGYALSSAGDANGDGYGDVLVGAYAGSSRGAAYLYLGSVAGLSPTAVETLYAAGTGARFGEAVSGGGDVNGDGYDDVAVGDADAVDGLGVVTVYTSSSTGDLTLATTFEGASYEALGSAVAGVGDVNGDGYNDVLVGAPGYRADTGRAYAFHGSAAGLSGTASTTFTGSARGDEYGDRVSAAGDLNNDGYDEVWIAGSSGSHYLYMGSATGLSTTSSDSISSRTSVIPAGDVNGDGYGDLLAISASNVYVYRGSASGLGSSFGTLSPSPGVTSAAPGGDVNGDGYDDIVVACRTASSNTGAVYVYTGRSSGVNTSPATSLTGYNPDDYFGQGAAGVGDLDGDGYDDVVVSAPGFDADTGRLYVYQGSAAGLVIRAVVDGAAAGDALGETLVPAGDVDLDGDPDVYVTAGGIGSYGTIYVYPGSGSGLSSTATDSFALPSSGTVWTPAGDVDGDGFSEILTGSGISTGSARIYAHYIDGDGDGHGRGDDCDDADATIGGPSVAYADADADGYGDAATATEQCSATAGWVSDATDCDDTDASIHPDAAEACDAADADEDCDGLADDADGDVTGLGTVYADADGDGYGDASAPTAACDADVGLSLDNTDCDDTSAAVHPAASEACDLADVDEDCNGSADDADSAASGKTAWYADADADGYGGAVAYFCDAPGSNYVSTSTDCDDATAAVNPGAAEVCDAADVDEDCDGASDDRDASATGQSTRYQDGDGDGFGGPTTGAYCDLPSGYAASSTDCDDTDPTVNPTATEACDAANADEDCDGAADDADTAASGKGIWYADADGDGYGGATSVPWCDAPPGYVTTSTDCDDGRTTTNPGAVEVCDAADTDEDCDGLADDADSSATGGTAWFVDADGDGFGGTTPATRCDLAPGFSAAPDDCDDGDAADNPAAVEAVGNGDDEDCDGAELCYADADADGFRATDVVASIDGDCDDPGEAAVTAAPDCDDADATVNGGTPEVAGDRIDQDCDGGETCFADADGDGYRPDSTSTVASADLDCDDLGEADATALVGDCNDTDAAFYPGAEEANCVDANDYNCDGSVGYVDGDGDGFAACQECDDARTAVNPSATEVCNGWDDDCDGDVDLDAADAGVWYADADGDGYADPAVSTSSCEPPDGYADLGAPDCDDADATRHPGGAEVAGDGIDQDCDGADLGGTGDDTGGPGKGEGCACNTGSGGGGAALFIAVAALGARRRR